MELYNKLGTLDPTYLLASGTGKRIAISIDPMNGTVKRGTLMYRKENSVLYAPAAAENVIASNYLAVLGSDVDTDESETVAMSAMAYIEGEFISGKVLLKDGTAAGASLEPVLRAQGIIFKPMDNPISAAVEAQNAYANIRVDADIADDDGTALLGKVASDLQENIVIGSAAISGNLKYIADYSSAGYTGDEQSGNFLVLHFESDAPGAVIKVQLVGGVHGERTLDDDGLAIFRVTNKDTQKVKATVSANGYLTFEKTWALTGLTLAGA